MSIPPLVSAEPSILSLHPPRPVHSCQVLIDSAEIGIEFLSRSGGRVSAVALPVSCYPSLISTVLLSALFFLSLCVGWGDRREMGLGLGGLFCTHLVGGWL